ncbi:MAG: hypothetical protein EH225_11195 [Calditrichaeota bacterium]|nr:PTS sugar transporter subunit IIC [Calditrichota bacterium]RQV92556.1 MAG: hypothetical protein EH221_11190 [bacterium]RQV99630.1 MAG: hypothetical protein EH225_11195 [Calditrichota bacterium]
MNLAFISFVISILSLDITIAFQVLISSPIFACPIIGWIMGDIWMGFEIGFLFQLLWLGRIPAGASIVPEGNIATMISTVLFIAYQEMGFPNSTLVIIFFLTIVYSYMGSLLTMFYRKFNGKILNLMNKQVQNVHFPVLILLEGGSMFFYLFSVFLFTLLLLKAGMLIMPVIIPAVGQLFESQFIIAKPVILGIGLASIFPVIRDALFRKAGKKIVQ